MFYQPTADFNHEAIHFADYCFKVMSYHPLDDFNRKNLFQMMWGSLVAVDVVYIFASILLIAGFVAFISPVYKTKILYLIV
jgi:hypothetical protein